MIVGRAKELETLKECLAADRSRLIVVYGRRRVGKTFLVREAFDYHFTFTHTGIEDGTLSEQLFGFWTSLREQWDDGCCKPGTWMEAFELLKRAIRHSTDDRKTVFIDELPWMDTRNSGFVKAVEAFWNGWASARKDVVMIVCGSAASWMVNKILQNRGGLFNRANRTIYLEPWTLHECEQYLAEQNNPMDRKDIAAAYMIFGGAPYYWSLLDKRESLSQSVDRLFFAPKAELGREFGRLYRSVFKEPETYVSVVTALATKRTGLTRDELVGLVPTLRNDGTLTHVLENLETCAFVRRYAETGKKKKGSVYQLVDNFTLFYFSFVKDYRGQDRQHWLHMVKDQKRIVWEGLAFELVCLLHSGQIKRKLGISGVATEESSWRFVSDDPRLKGAQIDLVIRRGDHVTNLCEIKYSAGEYEISADEAVRLREKVAAFSRETRTNDTCHLTFVTTYGLKRTKASCVVQSEVTLDDLFKEP